MCRNRDTGKICSHAVYKLHFGRIYSPRELMRVCSLRSPTVFVFCVLSTYSYSQKSLLIHIEQVKRINIRLYFLEHRLQCVPSLKGYAKRYTLFAH
jgi:hypothetical protein